MHETIEQYPSLHHLPAFDPILSSTNTEKLYKEILSMCPKRLAIFPSLSALCLAARRLAAAGVSPL